MQERELQVYETDVETKNTGEEMDSKFSKMDSFLGKLETKAFNKLKIFIVVEFSSAYLIAQLEGEYSWTSDVIKRLALYQRRDVGDT